MIESASFPINMGENPQRQHHSNKLACLRSDTMLILYRYAWNLASGAFFEATLPISPTACITHSNLVVVHLPRGGPIVWEPSCRLVEFNSTLFPPGMGQMQVDYPPFVIHPTEREILFAVILSDSHPWLSVREYTSTTKGYVVSNIFECNSRDILRHWHPSSRPRRNDLKVRPVDDHGTFQLMAICPSDAPEEVEHRFLLFNILSKSFSTQSYMDPFEQQSPSRGLQTHICCSWTNQLVYLSTQWSDAGAHPLLVALEERQSSHRRPGTIEAQKGFEQALQQMLSEYQNGDPLDIVQRNDITAKDPSLSGYCAAIGFQYACQTHPGKCCYICHDTDHTPACRSETASTLRHDACASNSRVPCNDGRDTLKYVFMDEDFLVVVTDCCYTVYCVDAGGKLAATVQRASFGSGSCSTY